MAKPWQRTLSRRAVLIGAGQTGIMGLIGWRMHQLGVQQSEDFRLLAEENRVSIRLEAPARGNFYDRQGQLLTFNQPVYAVDIIREHTNDPLRTLRALSQIIPLNPREIDTTLRDLRRRRAFVPIRVASGLTWEQVAQVDANAPALPGIVTSQALLRTYPQKDVYAHVIGYTGRVSDSDLQKEENSDPLLLLPKFPIGKNGIEYKNDLDLRGAAGIKRIEVNAVGREMRALDKTAPTPGKALQLTTSSTLQEFALRRFGEESGAAVVLDVRNGDVLAVASAPSFDPNLFVDGISSANYRALNENERRPLANKAVQGTYPPGSTFKMLVGLTGLRLGLLEPSERVFCPGHFNVNKQRFHCWRPGGHGRVNLVQALRESCDVFFYELALKVGIEEITKTAQSFGLGIAPDVPLRAVANGLTPTKDWKRQVKDEQWYLGDTVNSSIGQGFVLASPMQLAIMTARIASGKMIVPRMINSVNSEIVPIAEPEPVGYSDRALEQVRKGMFEVVNHSRGTARGSRLPNGPIMAGKTGTSQVRFITAEERAKGVIKNEDLPWRRRDHALFVGYAPYDNPQLAIAVVVEHGGGGSRAAAPIARDILDLAFNGDQRDYRPLQQPQRDAFEASTT